MKRTTISLYTGAGGLDLGLEAAGFETGVAVEMDEAAVKTLRHNRDWPVFGESIHDVTSAQLLEAAQLKVGEAALLAGGPPCQPFSKSGYWKSGDTKRLDDHRATTIDAYLRVLRDTQPKAFLMENVAGLAYKQKGEGLQLIRDTVRSINEETGTNYSLEVKLLNAADFGVPQERERVFLIGHIDGLKFEFPEPTHAREPQEGQLPHRTAWDALGDLESIAHPELKVTGKWADLLPSIPEGENYLFHTDRGAGKPLFGWRRRYWSFLLKLSKKRPSWTITAQPGSAIGPFHWKSRRFSSRELCRLQTVPDDYEVLGGTSTVQRQLGNAVPSALAEVLGYEIRRQLLGESDLDIPEPSLIPGRREPVPSAERPRPVAPKYLALIGEHSPHPGTGKGYGAIART